MRMMILVLVAMAAALMSACVYGERSSGAPGESAHFNGQLTSNQAVSLEVAGNIGVDISVIGSSGQGLKLDAVPANGLSGVKLTTSNDSQRLLLRLDPSGSRQRHLKWLSENHADVTVNLSVPRDRAVTISAVNGPVRVDDVHGPLNVRIVNGLIRVNGAGCVLSLHAVNGPIDVSISDLSRTPDVEVAGTNGSIAVTVPNGFRARVDAHTVFGPTEQEVNDSQAPGVVTLRLVAGPITIKER
jgi:hypothetical protein